MGSSNSVASHFGGLDLFSGMALLVTMVTIAWGIRLSRRVQGRYERLLVGSVGLVSAYQGLRLIMAPTGWNTGGVLLCLAAMAGLRGLAGERRRTEMALRLAEANVRPPGPSEAIPFLGGPLVRSLDISSTLLDAAPMAMFAVGIDGLISYWNPAAERTLGWRRDEVLGQKMPFNMVARPEAGTPDGIVHLVGKDGGRVSGPVRSVPVRDAKGEVSGILTIVSV